MGKTNLNIEESNLLYFNRNSQLFLKILKKNKSKIIHSYLDKFNNIDEILNKINIEFFNFFKKKSIENYTYVVAYYSFQSFLFSDPYVYFLHCNEDFIQELLYKTHIAFKRYIKKYYSFSNFLKVKEIVSFETFVLKNYSRCMVLELNNLKRVIETENKKPSSFFNNDDINYYDFLKNHNYGYEINEELLFPNFNNIKYE